LNQAASSAHAPTNYLSLKVLSSNGPQDHAVRNYTSHLHFRSVLSPPTILVVCVAYYMYCIAFRRRTKLQTRNTRGYIISACARRSPLSICHEHGVWQTDWPHIEFYYTIQQANARFMFDSQRLGREDSRLLAHVLRKELNAD